MGLCILGASVNVLSFKCDINLPPLSATIYSSEAGRKVVAEQELVNERCGKSGGVCELEEMYASKQSGMQSSKQIRE